MYNAVMKQTGIVQQADGDTALIAGERASTCGSCAGKSSCSTLGAWNQRTLELRVYNDIGAEAGDEVVIEVPDHLVLKSAYTLYGLPMLFFFVAGVAAYFVSQRFGVGQPDVMASLSGIAAVVIYYTSGVLKVQEKEGLDARIVQINSRSDVMKLACHTAE